MILREWIRAATERLRSREVASPGMEAQLLACHVLGVDRSWIMAHPENDFNDLAGENLLQRREAGEPLAYILGWREFFGRRFSVDPSVLIPRHETETLVETALRDVFAERDPVRLEQFSVLDMGTGSGVIAITLKLERPEWEVTGVDKSPDALATASANARFHKAKVRLVLSDAFSALVGESFDLIVSNPPYIGRSEEILAEVREHEPDLALFADNHGLAFYELLAEQAPAHLNDDGTLLVEVGYKQADKVVNLFTQGGWRVVQRANDLSGVARVIGFKHDYDRNCNN